MRYINYARRSSDEKSKKQVQSIEDQLSDTRRYARESNLEITAEMTESKSAKEPGRPVFNTMIEKIRQGDADGILCWKLDRLARNPIDAATLRWMMRQGLLKEIRTPYQIYSPDDNAVIAAVENAMAEQYIIDLKKGVERGMRSKCEKGGFPFMAPQGYSNNRLNQTVEKDPARFPLIQKAWQLLLSEQHTTREIHHLLVNEWGYRSRTNGVNSSGKLTCSGLYKIFRNSFYKGEFRFQGVTYQHNFPRMVTAREWDRAQAILNRRARKGKTRYLHCYTGLITCASCGFSITAEISKGHTYYHCANRLGICTKKGMREEEITKRIDCLLESVTLDTEFEEFALRVLEELQAQEVAVQRQTGQLHQEALQRITGQKDALLSLYLAGHVTQVEYATKKQELLQQESELLPVGVEQNAEENAATTEKLQGVIHFTTHARTLFQIAEPEMKRRIAHSVGMAYILNNGRELQVELHPCLVPVRTSWKKQWRQFHKVEPQKISYGNLKKPVAGLEFQQWCASFLEYRALVEQNTSDFSPLTANFAVSPSAFACTQTALSTEELLVT